MHTTPSTSIRISREVRESLRRLEEELGLTTSETVGKAVASLLDELKWKKVGEYYDANPELDPEDEAWIKGVSGGVAKLLAADEAQ